MTINKMNVSRINGKSSFGKTVTFNYNTFVPDVLVTPARIDHTRLSDEHLLVWRDTCTIDVRRMDIKSRLGNLALARHAIERIHERSLGHGYDIGLAISAELQKADIALSFVAAAGIHLGPSAKHPNAATAIPFLDGLLFVKNRIIMVRRTYMPETWHEIRACGIIPHQVILNEHITVPVPDLWETPMTGIVMASGVTYLSYDMMNSAQMGYRDWFIRQMDQHADHLEHVAKMPVGKMCDDAATEHGIIVPDIGRRLLSNMISQHKLLPIMSIGWERHLHPSNW